MKSRITLAFAPLALLVIFLSWQGAMNVVAQQTEPAADSKDVESSATGPFMKRSPNLRRRRSTLRSSSPRSRPNRSRNCRRCETGGRQRRLAAGLLGVLIASATISFGSAASGATFRRASVGGRILDAGSTGFRWTPGYWSESTPQQTYYPPPPEAVRTRRRPRRTDDSYYVAGTWIYRDTRYMWRPGLLDRASPRLDVTQPHYSWTPRVTFRRRVLGLRVQSSGRPVRADVFRAGVFRGSKTVSAIVRHRVRPARWRSLFIRPTVERITSRLLRPRYVGLVTRRGSIPLPRPKRRSGLVVLRVAKPRHASLGTTDASVVRRPSARRRTGARATHQPQTAPKGNVQSVNLVMPLQQLQAKNEIKLHNGPRTN